MSGPLAPRRIGVSRGFRLAWTALLLIATTAPYVVAWLRTPPGAVFTWILPPYPEDSLAYQAWVRQAMDGQLLFSLKYTAQPHTGFLFQPFFLLAGWLARGTGWSPGLTLLVLKTVGVALFLHVFFAFLAFLRMPRARAHLASVLLGTSSGLGGLCAWTLGSDHLARALGTQPPADLWLVDLTTWWALEWNPLFPYSLSLIVGSVHALWAAFRRPGLVAGLRAGALVAVLALVHPYQVPLLYALGLLLAVLWRTRARLVVLAAFFGVSGPVVAFSALQSARHPLLAQHALAGRMESPGLFPLLLGLGLPLALAIAGLRRDVRRIRVYAPLVLWIGLALGLAYAPWWFQRKLLFGLSVPLCIWAAWAWDRLRLGGARTAAILALAATTPIHLLQVQFRDLASARGPASPYAVSPDLAAALTFLRVQVPHDEVVLATFETSRLIPAWAGQPVIWGHWAQSVDLATRREEMRRALHPGGRVAPALRAEAFWSSGARWVVVDTLLRDAFSGAEPPWFTATTRVVFEQGDVQVRQRSP